MKIIIYISIFFSLLFGLGFRYTSEDWGFFGHRKINRYAVFTLPEEMLPLYKKYIDYLEEHAVDPDKRRYATKFEAIRHYIDLDQWGNYPFDQVPRKFNEALGHYSKLMWIDQNDTLSIDRLHTEDSISLKIGSKTYNLHKKEYYNFFQKNIIPIYYEDDWKINLQTAPIGMLNKGTLIVVDTFSQHGILPYYLPMALSKLTKAFENGNVHDIIRHSADIGHYIGDAHVPLHTTKNYNGQLTNQLGIHAFWESRLPELFAETEYDFFAGKAEYIDNPNTFFWNIVLESHSHLQTVLNLEKELSQTFPSDKQFCYDERLGQTTRIQCQEYAKAYHDGMQGMVEERMMSSVKSIGSIWLTAWTNAGQPNLNKILQNQSIPAMDTDPILIDPKVKARDHD